MWGVGEAQGRDQARLLRAGRDQRVTFDLCLEGGKAGSREELLWTLSPQGQRLPLASASWAGSWTAGGCPVRV